MKASLRPEAAERPRWPRLYSLGTAKSCDRMPSLVGDRGPVLRVLGWALTRMRNISLLVQRVRDGSKGVFVCGTEP